MIYLPRLQYLALLILCASSCTVIRYAPNPQNVPLFTEKNQLRLTGGGAGTSETNQVSFQGAYSFANHFGTMLNYTSFEGGNDVGRHGNAHLTEFGLAISPNLTPIYPGFLKIMQASVLEKPSTFMGPIVRTGNSGVGLCNLRWASIPGISKQLFLFVFPTTNPIVSITFSQFRATEAWIFTTSRITFFLNQR